MIIRRVPNDHQFTLLLWDGHGEYAWSEQKGTTCLTERVFDVAELGDTATDFAIGTDLQRQTIDDDPTIDTVEAYNVGRARAEAAFDALFPHADTLADADAYIGFAREYGTLLSVTGTFDQLDAAFTELASQLADKPHGDDDVYDYWPSGARLLEQLGDDLDTIAESEDHQQVVKARWLEYVEEFGTEDGKVPDWVLE